MSTTGSLARFVRWCSIGVQSPGASAQGAGFGPLRITGFHTAC